MTAASRSHSPDGDLRSFLYGPGLRILVGMGLGYISHRLWAGPQYLLDTKLAQLDAAPTIQFESVRSREIPREGELVLLQNSVANRRRHTITIHRSESRCQSDTCRVRGNPYYNTDDHVVSVKPVEDYDDTRLPNQHVCCNIFLAKGSQYGAVNVKNIDSDHIPMEIRWYGRAGWTRFLRRETLFKSVFGRLSKEENGDMYIEPCQEFPKECFSMTRPEIAKAVRAQVEADPNTGRVRTWGLGVGFVSFGFILSGIYSYAMRTSGSG